MANTRESIEAVVGGLVGEGIVDKQFEQLVRLQDDGNPHFAAEVVEMFLKRSAAVLQDVEQRLGNGNPDFGEADRMVHQYKGSSATVGAHLIAKLCVALREGCGRQDHALCLKLLAQLKAQVSLFSSRMEPFLKLDGQREGC